MSLGQSHPELCRRWELLVGRVWALGGELWVEASTRSRATQEALYTAWRNGTYVCPAVADPYQHAGFAPGELGGWPIIGSYHMTQGDGYSHALDLGWRGVADDVFFALAEQSGLQRTVPREKWHYQWFSGGTIFPVVEPELPHMEEDDMTVIHQPQPRVDAAGAPVLLDDRSHVWDFTWLPQHDSERSKGTRTRSVVIMRISPTNGVGGNAVVYCDGDPMMYSLPADGRSIAVPVRQQGLVSVVCDQPLDLHAREEVYVP